MDSGTNANHETLIQFLMHLYYTGTVLEHQT